MTQSKQIREMIEEAVAAFLDEINYNDRMAALKTQQASAGGGGEDQLMIGKLIGALDNMRKAGKTTLSMGELQGALKTARAISAPMGKGKMSDLAGVTQAAQAASGPTGGAPVVKPPSFLTQREGKVRMTEKQLKEKIARIVAAKLAESTGGIGMGNPIMAKREIIALMDSTARSFEQEIIKTFKLQSPDQLSADLQRAYLEVVEGMKAKMVQAAMSAVESLIKFPKVDEGNGGIK